MNVNSPYVICHGNEDDDCGNGAVTANSCFDELDKCIGYHKNYFSLNIGDFCAQTLGISARAKLWSGSLPYQCQSFNSTR